MEEDLTSAQIQYQQRLTKEFKVAQSTLDNAVKVSGAECVYKGEYIQAYLASPGDG